MALLVGPPVLAGLWAGGGLLVAVLLLGLAMCLSVLLFSMAMASAMTIDSPDRQVPGR
jgi:hypothetical protein